MTGQRFALRAALAMIAFATPSWALDPEAGEQAVSEQIGSVPFYCQFPPEPIDPSSEPLCRYAKSLPDCSALERACERSRTLFASREDDEEKEKGGLRVPESVRALAGSAIWALLALTVFGALAFIVFSFVRVRREKLEGDAEPRVPGDWMDDAYAADRPLAPSRVLLAQADHHFASHDLEHAATAYLSAGLAALSERGAIQIARDRTNGEYLRECSIDSAKPLLRELAREADEVQFGARGTTADAVARARHAAHTLVGLAILLLAALSTLGCGREASEARVVDPSGPELVMRAVRDQDIELEWLGDPLEKLGPFDKKHPDFDTLIIDFERTTLSDDASGRLVRWIEGGGEALLLGNPEAWPGALKSKRTESESLEARFFGLDDETDITGGESEEDNDATPPDETDMLLEIRPEGSRAPEQGVDPSPSESIDALDEERDRTGDDDPLGALRPDPYRIPPSTSGGHSSKERATVVAHLARPGGLDRVPPRTLIFARVGQGEKGEPYAAETRLGEGHVVFAASSDLLTNAGIASPGNAKPAMLLLARLDGMRWRWVRHTRATPSPVNPIESLSRAGMGWMLPHALVCALLVFVAVGYRLRPPRRSSPRPERSFREHVEGTATLHARAHSTTWAVGAYARFVEDRVLKRAGHGPADIVDQLALQSGFPREHVHDIWMKVAEARGGALSSQASLEALKELGRIYVATIEQSPTTNEPNR